jgi:riboflavin kinase/FMN adenylyltransferase
LTTTFTRGIENYRAEGSRGVIATLGTFDGIHRGHQAILHLLGEECRRSKLEGLLITFHPHPKVVVEPDNIPMLLTTIEEKEKFIPDFFDGQVLILQFNTALRTMSAESFVRDILVEKIGVKKLIVGYDHAFGRDRRGSIAELRTLGDTYGFDVTVVDPVIVDGQPVSSSRIRRSMKAGRFPEAIQLLGHEYAIYGTVERGIGLGRKLGFPTANINYSNRKLLPPDGVYSCWSQVVGRDVPGMMFIGQNHFNPARKISVEANLFNFDQDIYDEEIIIYPGRFLRENRKYASTEALARQIERDKKNVLELLHKGESECR